MGSVQDSWNVSFKYVGLGLGEIGRGDGRRIIGGREYTYRDCRRTGSSKVGSRDLN